MEKYFHTLIELFAFKPRDFSMHPFHLTFNDDKGVIETDFLTCFYRKSIHQRRYALLFGFVLFSLLGLFILSQNQPVQSDLFWISLGANIIFPLVILFTFAKTAQKFNQWLFMLVLLVSSLNILVVQASTIQNGDNLVTISLVLVILYCFTALRMRFIFTLLASFIVSAVYLMIGLSWLKMPAGQIWVGFIFLAATVLVGLLTSYILEYASRREYFEIVHLTCEKQEVKMLNVNLEKTVMDRTQQLSIREVELSETRKQLDRYNTHDMMTGLPNLTLLQDRLEHALKMSKRKRYQLAVILLNLDDFKSINDAYSYAVGDMLLKSVTKRLQSSVRESDTVARVGVDEFAILLEGINDWEDISRIIQKILHEITKPFQFGKLPVVITASVGVSVYPEHGESVWELLKNAGAAISRSKSLGGNDFHFFTEEMEAGAFEKVSMISEMVNAIGKDEFRLFYQPQVDIRTGKITGVEALLRWQHPERGLLFPGDFIQIAEKKGMITRIGNWVLTTACKQNKAWQDAGLPEVKMSVNISERQLRKNLVELVKNALAISKLEPQWLELEFRENIVFQNIDRVPLVFKELENLGVSLAIDDFGAGYTTLYDLGHIPFSTLKIDRSLASKVTLQPNDAAIVTGIVGIASKLGMNVIAEGVETRDQINFYEHNGCDQIQGWYFSKAVPDNDVPDLLKSNFDVT